MLQITNFLSGLFSRPNYSSGPDADLAKVNGSYICESFLESEAILQEIPQEIWEHNIVSNLSIFDSKNLCLVSKNFTPILKKELGLAAIIFNSIKPYLLCKLSKELYVDCYKPQAFNMSYYLKLSNLSVIDTTLVTKEDIYKSDIHITELWGLKAVNSNDYSFYVPIYVERFEGLEYKIINNSIISDVDKRILDKIMSCIKERAINESAKLMKK